MSGEGHRGRPAPRHLAQPIRRPSPPAPAPAPVEEVRRAHVPRRHLVLAAAVTLAAVPALVLDNLPATADAQDAKVEAVGAASSDQHDQIPTLPAPSPPTTTTTVAPPTTTTTTTAPPPVEVAPPTTEAPAPTPEVAVIVEPAPAPPTTQAPPPPPPPPPPTASGDAGSDATWERLAACESGGRWTLNSGNGYYGGLQFSLPTWQAVGGAGYPHTASKAEQITRGRILQARAGWGQWPHCAAELGLI